MAALSALARWRAEVRSNTHEASTRLTAGSHSGTGVGSVSPAGGVNVTTCGGSGCRAQELTHAIRHASISPRRNVRLLERFCKLRPSAGEGSGDRAVAGFSFTICGLRVEPVLVQCLSGRFLSGEIQLEQPYLRLRRLRPIP